MTGPGEFEIDFHYGGRATNPALEAAARDTLGDAIRVARSAMAALRAGDAERFARTLTGYLDHPDPVQYCARLNSLVSVLLHAAARLATAKAGGAPGPREVISVVPAQHATPAARAVLAAVSCAANNDVSAATDVLMAYSRSHPAGGAAAVLPELCGVVEQLSNGVVEVHDHDP